MIEQIFHGYFEEGRNIADVDVLLDLANKVCVVCQASSCRLLLVRINSKDCKPFSLSTSIEREAFLCSPLGNIRFKQ